MHMRMMHARIGIRVAKLAHTDSKRYVPIWDLRGGGHVRCVRRPDATNGTGIRIRQQMHYR